MKLPSIAPLSVFIFLSAFTITNQSTATELVIYDKGTSHLSGIKTLQCVSKDSSAKNWMCSNFQLPIARPMIAKHTELTYVFGMCTAADGTNSRPTEMWLSNPNLTADDLANNSRTCNPAGNGNAVELRWECSNTKNFSIQVTGHLKCGG